MKNLLKYLSKRELEINLILAKPASRYTVATFHKLRVEIKKIHSLFDLLEATNKHFKYKKVAQPIDVLFRQAGKVRDIQIEEALLKKYFFKTELNGYRRIFRQRLLNELTKYFLISDRKYSAELKKRFSAIEEFTKKVKKEDVDFYLSKREKVIHSLMHKKKLHPKQIHELRKVLKKVGYVKNSLSIEKGVKFTAANKVLEELLGKWHDCQVMVNHLNKLITGEIVSRNELIKLRSIKKKINTEKNDIYKNILLAFTGSEYF